jgi:hypothetical protein
MFDYDAELSRYNLQLRAAADGEGVWFDSGAWLVTARRPH